MVQNGAIHHWDIVWIPSLQNQKQAQNQQSM